MNLWIRSQDKTILILAQHFDIYDCTLEDDEEQHWCIEESGVDLGEYPSKERALEILDEIQNLMQPPTNFIVSQHIDFNDAKEGLIGVNVLKEEPKIEKISDVIVYEMPKE